ncbi:nucleotidyltransferase domain-containing protein [Polyangium aurulentum]|uniref:nucleotidyltransferase domain-containing protein n=1 Tax=Polyangium aurulentum TaxID=2567896 RepID=UPI0010AEDA32|nr:nucleotidyltransferase domain-containing protein [Polyangium aurulentum]UQA56147.1 nucleotidyltransferase domain-containing protein [Polyangium aurulentum]
MSSERFGGLRARIAVEAARLMYEEGVKQYFTAKRMAAKRMLGRTGGKKLRYRPQDLPSNGEIRDALLAMAELAEGDRRTRRLFAMRVVALEAMRALLPFEPRLIGSVSTGHIRRGSDIDIQVFTDDEDALERRLRALGWAFDSERVSILKFGQIREYLHHHVADVFPIELTVYALRELRFRPRSSTDGQPIHRVRVSALEALLLAEHPEAWAHYKAEGKIAELDAILAEEDDDDAPVAGPFDGLLGAEGEEMLEGWIPGEEEALDGDYDPLPGFEEV